MLDTTDSRSFVLRDGEPEIARVYYHPQPLWPKAASHSEGELVDNAMAFVSANADELRLMPNPISSSLVPQPSNGSYLSLDEVKPSATTMLAPTSRSVRFAQRVMVDGAECRIGGAGLTLTYTKDLRLIGLLNTLHYSLGLAQILGGGALARARLEENLDSFVSGILIAVAAQADPPVEIFAADLSFSAYGFEVIPLPTRSVLQDVPPEGSSVRLSLLVRLLAPLADSPSVGDQVRYALAKIVIVRFPFYRPTCLRLAIASLGDQLYIVAARELTKDASPSCQARIYLSDPVTAGLHFGHLTLPAWGSSDAADIKVYENLLSPVQVDGLEQEPASENSSLEGRHCSILQVSEPANGILLFANGSFSATPFSPQLAWLSAYYWIDRFKEFVISELGISGADYPLHADPLGNLCGDNAHFEPTALDAEGKKATKGVLDFGLGQEPDAIDGGIVIHETVHAVQAGQGVDLPSDLSEGLADVVARLYLDEFDPSRATLSKIFTMQQEQALKLLNSVFRFQKLNEKFRRLDILSDIASFSCRYRKAPTDEGASLFAALLWTSFEEAAENSGNRLKAAKGMISAILHANETFEFDLNSQDPYGAGTFKAVQVMAFSMLCHADPEVFGKELHAVLLDRFRKAQLIPGPALAL
jgi:hypothetical protein